MSNEVINHPPSIERAQELEQQAKEGLDQIKLGQDKAIIACHKMRDTKAYKTLGFDSYYDWGESTLNLKKSRLNELALAGEVQQELLISSKSNVEQTDPQTIDEGVNETESSAPYTDNQVSGNDNSDILVAIPANLISSVSELPEITTPQLLALAKAPKGERLAVLDKVVVEAKEDDKPISTRIIKEVVKAFVDPVDDTELSDHEEVIAVKKQHKSAMSKVSKLTEALNELDTTRVDSEDVENWKAYLDGVKLSISTLEKQLGYE